MNEATEIRLRHTKSDDNIIKKNISKILNDVLFVGWELSI